MFVPSVPQDKWVSRVYQVLKCGACSFHGRHFKIQYHCVVQAGIIGVHHQHTQHSCMILCDSSSRKWAGAKVVESNLQKKLIHKHANCLRIICYHSYIIILRMVLLILHF